MSAFPSSPLPAAARRLLEALASPDAAACLDPFDPSRVVARARRGGVSLTVASAPLDAAQALVEAGLCVWAHDPAGARLTRSPAKASGPLEAARPSPAPSAAAGARGRLVDAAESPLAWRARRRGQAGGGISDSAAFPAGERGR